MNNITKNNESYFKDSTILKNWIFISKKSTHNDKNPVTTNSVKVSNKIASTIQTILNIKIKKSLFKLRAVLKVIQLLDIQNWYHHLNQINRILLHKLLNNKVI